MVKDLAATVFNLARGHTKMGNHEAAVCVFNESLADSLRKLGDNLRAVGRYEDAARAETEADALGVDSGEC